MRARFWGARGSLPAPLTAHQVECRLREVLSGAVGVDLRDPRAVEQYLQGLPVRLRGTYGGNTACVEVRNRSGDLLIIDAGSGLRNLGVELSETEFGRGGGEAVLLFTHTHWDHIQGLPHFLPFYTPGNRFHLCGRHASLEERLRLQQDPAFFPVGLDEMAASLRFHTVGDDECFFDGRYRVRSMRQDHPGDSYAYRIEADGKSFVFASDAEYRELTDGYLARYLDFFRGAQALVFDSQFSLRETLYDKAEWGHSSALIGIDLALEAGVETLVLFHHDPSADDLRINRMFDDAVRYLRRVPGRRALRVVVGHEGLDLQL